jgi:NAD(P)H-hydrate epimerase
MRQWEAASWAAGKSETEVIRAVGKAVARRVLQLTTTNDRVLVVAGKGHNGDDARCVSDHLPDRRLAQLEVKDPRSDLARLDALLDARPALIVDGLFGIGINRPLAPEWIRLIEKINQTQIPILAVDIPSGLNGDTGEPQGASVRASITLTVGAPKVGLIQAAASPYVGRLEMTDDVGLLPCPATSEIQWTIPADFARFPPPRPVAGHKGTFGHLAIIAGSRGFHGAAVLAARGAQRAQPGLITLLPQESVYLPVASQLQAVMVHPWENAKSLVDNCDAVLVGPGLAAAGLPDALRSQAVELWRNFPGPIIADASALAWLEPAEITAEPARLRVITPHPGEAGRLLGIPTAQVQAERVLTLRRLSRKFGGCWVVLKGSQTLVGRETGEVFVNSSGNPHLAQGGSGDLLSGYLAGLLAQPALRESPGLTLRYGVWQHGAAADKLSATRPNWVVEDLAMQLGCPAT